MSETSQPIFTAVSLNSLAGVVAIGAVAYTASKILLPKDTRWQDKFTFIWLVRISPAELLLHSSYSLPLQRHLTLSFTLYLR